MKKIIVGVVLFWLLMPCFAGAERNSAVTVAVVPFESFTGEQNADLGRDVAVKLLQQLAAHPLIMTPDVESMKDVFAANASGALTEERLGGIAERLGVNFLLFGSVTALQDALSVDVQVYYNFPGEHYFKTYAEGPDVDRVVQTLARKLEAELLDNAADVPADQRPKMQPRPLPLSARPDAAAYEVAVDRELAKERYEREAGSGDIRAAESTRLEDLDEAVGAAPAVVDEGERPAKRRERARESLPLKLEQPINISSDSMDFSNQENSAVFRGNVIARQGDIVMFAEQMRATYGAKAGGGSGKGGIRELVATGNVKIIQGDRIATGQRIVFYGDEQKIVATGNPRVWQGDNVIVGAKITVYLRQDRSVVEGTPRDRVSATIYPKQKKGAKN